MRSGVKRIYCVAFFSNRYDRARLKIDVFLNLTKLISKKVEGYPWSYAAKTVSFEVSHATYLSQKSGK